jgi:invasion protein IalB
MIKTKFLLPALVFAATTGFAQAQTATETQATETAPAQEAAPAVDPNLDTGKPDEPQIGQAYIREEIGDWQLQCAKQDDPATEPCQMYQLLRGAQNNPVAEVVIEKLPNGGQVAAGATIAVPHGTALSKDLRISVDGGKGKVYRYAFCDGASCYARIGLLQTDIAAFQKGNVAQIVIFPFEAQDQPVELSLSLTGFTAAFEATRAATPPAQ